MPKKSFGQHFLRDTSVVEHILTCIEPKPSDHFVEIGPGQGVLTFALLHAPVAYLDAIEVERDVFAELKKRCTEGGMLHLNLHLADALSFDFNVLGKAGLRLVGNLPYNIGSPLLFHCLAYTHLFRDMHFMLQKEVVDRIIASPMSKSYGRLSVMVQYHCEVRFLFDVPPLAFYPPPRVMSSIFRLVPRRKAIGVPVANNLTHFSEVVKQAFSQRRKMISNSLASFITKDELKELGIDPKQRPEQLSVEAFVAISNRARQITER